MTDLPLTYNVNVKKIGLIGKCVSRVVGKWIVSPFWSDSIVLNGNSTLASLQSCRSVDADACCNAILGSYHNSKFKDNGSFMVISGLRNETDSTSLKYKV